MSNPKQLDINATVSFKTYNYLIDCGKELGLSNGEVIDRAIYSIQTADPVQASIFLMEQFTLATKHMDDSQQAEAFYYSITTLIVSLLHNGMPLNDIFNQIIRMLSLLDDSGEL